VFGENQSGTIIVLRLIGDNNVNDVAITYDNDTLDQVNLSEILAQNGSDTGAKYARILTESENGKIVYCLIYIPHFSGHEITITTLREAVLIIGGIIAITAYVIICVVVATGFLYPVFSGTLLHRRRKSK